MTPEQKLLQSVFGKRTDSDKLRDIESAISNAIFALNAKKVTKWNIYDSIRELEIARQTLRELDILKSDVNSEYEFNVERFAQIERE